MKLKKGKITTLDCDLVRIFKKHGIEVLKIQTKKDKKGNPVWMITGKWLYWCQMKGKRIPKRRMKK